MPKPAKNSAIIYKLRYAVAILRKRTFLTKAWVNFFDRGEDRTRFIPKER